MASFYADSVAAELFRLGHAATTAHTLGLLRSHDAQQLLTAVQHGWTFITCNGRDFLLLHRAWVLWPRALGLTPIPEHLGILVIPQQPGRVPAIAREIDALVKANRPLRNTLYTWSPTAGWVSRS